MSPDNILGGLYGLLVGDAVGVPYEFTAPEDIPPLEEIEMVPPAGFHRAHPSAPRGAWSDDGAQALCLLSSLLDCGRLDLDDLGRRLLDWYDHGYLAVDGVVFDVGRTTAVALNAIRRGTPAAHAGPSSESDNGNGSMMRVLPLALWHTGTLDELIEAAALQSTVTHGHLRSQVGCAAYALWAWATLHREQYPWGRAATILSEYAANRPEWRREVDRHFSLGIADIVYPRTVSGTGYVVDSFHSAVNVFGIGGSYECVIRKAIALGNDTDTTAALAGGIAGLRHGISDIPRRWLDGLAGQEIVKPLADRLVAHVERERARAREEFLERFK